MDWLSTVLQTKNNIKVKTIVKVKSIKGRYDKRNLDEIMKKYFYSFDAIVFMAATGIAVRAIAPYVKSKASDPAVVVMDEKMQFAISLLSGHLGGANELTRILSTVSGAVPVITTATDIENEFAVDVFAKRNSLSISNLSMIKEVTSKVLEGKKVGFVSDISLRKLKGAPEVFGDAETGILITNDVNKKVFKKQLTLYPKNLYVGIGMKKGTKASDIKKFIEKVFEEASLSTSSIKCLSTIDIKKEEPGLLEYAAKNKLKLKSYSARQLRGVVGEFSTSDFVKSVTGVDNVCERAAMMAAKSSGELIVSKKKGNGITIAVVMRNK